MPTTPFIRECLNGWLAFIAVTLFVVGVCYWRWCVFRRRPREEAHTWESMGHVIRLVVFLFMTSVPTYLLMVDGNVSKRNYTVLKERLSLAKTKNDIHAVLEKYAPAWQAFGMPEKYESARIQFSYFSSDVVSVTYRMDGTVERFRIGY